MASGATCMWWCASGCSALRSLPRSLPRLLTLWLAYADAMPPRYFAGVFESSSWIPSRAVMIGWGMHPEWTKRTHGHRYHNCTRDGSVPDTYGDYQPGDVCTGPFWFAKGPLRMLDREAARALLSGTGSLHNALSAGVRPPAVEREEGEAQVQVQPQMQTRPQW